MRQAQDSEIIRLSMWVREGKSIKDFKTSNSEVMIISPKELTTGMYSWADQILCATNSKRNTINAQVRRLNNFGPEPQIGDKIISLQNHWEFFSSGNLRTQDSDSKNSRVEPAPLTNGSIGTIETLQQSHITLPLYIGNGTIPILYTTMYNEDGDHFAGIPVDYTALTTGTKLLTPQQEYKMKKSLGCPNPPFEFAYAYGITTWKAQGSEWKKVLGFEESFPYEKETHQKFLYTMITRASEKLVLVKK